MSVPSIDEVLDRLSYSAHGPMHDAPGSICGVCSAIAVLRAVRPLLERLPRTLGEYAQWRGLSDDERALIDALLAPSATGETGACK